MKQAVVRKDPVGAPPPGTSPPIDAMSVDTLRQRVERARALVREIEALFPGLTTLSEDDRRASDGRVRGDEERGALSSILDAVDANPAVFACLADKDDGVDPTRVETGLLRDRLARQQCLADLSALLAPIARSVEDTALEQGERCKPVILAAYQIARPVAKHDAAMRAKLVPAIDYYSAIARKGARTRAAAKAAPDHDDK